jgi:hypothetical protein
MIASEAGLANELPVLPVLFVMPLATTLNVYDVPVVRPPKPHDGSPVTRVRQVPDSPALGLGVTRYEVMPAPTDDGGFHDTVTAFGFPS